MSASLLESSTAAAGRHPVKLRRKTGPRPKRVLVADDSSSGRLMMSQMLRGLGLHVEVAENGRVACNRVLSTWKAGEPFDLVLMDCQMPEVDGTAATAVIRGAGYEGLIIALTPEHDLLGFRDKCLGAGCDACASKPITFPMLREVVRRNLPGEPWRPWASGPR